MEVGGPRSTATTLVLASGVVKSVTGLGEIRFLLRILSTVLTLSMS